MARRNSRRNRRRRQEGFAAYVWLLIFVVGVAAAGFVAWQFFRTLDQIDSRTGCITNRPHSKHTVFLVDRSDDFSERQITDLKRILVQTFTELEVNELFSIYAIGGEVPSIPVPLGQFCRPPQSSEEGNQISGQNFLDQRYERIFSANVDPILDNLTSPLKSDESPLLEWIVAISESREFAAPPLQDRRMVLFSDMVQYVPQEGFRHCGRFPDFGDFRRGRYFGRVATDLNNVRVTVFNVRRAFGDNCTVAAQRDMQALEDFWFAYFDHAGASMSPRRFTRIGE